MLLLLLQRIVVGPSENKSKTSSSTPDSKANRVVVTKASSSGKPSNRVVIGSLPEAITPSRLKELLQGIGPIQVDTATNFINYVCKGFSLMTKKNPGFFMILTGDSAELSVQLLERDGKINGLPTLWQPWKPTHKIPWHNRSPYWKYKSLPPPPKIVFLMKSESKSMHLDLVL